MVRHKVLNRCRHVTAWIKLVAQRVPPSLEYFLLDYILISISLLVVHLLLEPFGGLTRTGYPLMDHILWCWPTMVSLFLSGSYRSVWSRARLSEFVFVGLGLLVSVSTSFGVGLLLGADFLREHIIRALLFFGLASVFVLGTRILSKVLSGYVGFSTTFLKRRTTKKEEKVLIYGAGIRCRQYLERLAYAKSRGGRIKQEIVGLIDDEKNLRKRYVQGYQVLGNSAELPKCLLVNQIDKIVLTCSLSQDALGDLVQVCARQRVSLSVFNTKEHQAYSRCGHLMN